MLRQNQDKKGAGLREINGVTMSMIAVLKGFGKGGRGDHIRIDQETSSIQNYDD